ncbi:MAG: hypothetical protein CMP91_01235 [Gammaproteobacteria bacterium]|nr:hypothetical protein [Gammaproteobacteria bacterium]|tara:strand:+ start:489373 stop:491067 length:1695 start_codon:yes stop_codon:yes gene_type:complete
MTLFSSLIGGLGLLLIGMTLMTDGLKLAAGNTLRDFLALWTNTRSRGLFSGFLITGIVQSSSAVTVATIGFANAGMLSLERAVWVIYGSNVGTTMTAWIVALVGFQVNIEGLALPLVGIGALLKLTGADSRRASLGMALVGFGLLFLGISILKTSFESLGSDFSFPVIDNLNVLVIFIYVLLGFLLTTLMQSSSAAMVIALSAAEGGLLGINAAAAVVIGANLGTTTTALISVFGATPTAKRVAMSHVFFNLLTALVAVFLLSPMLWLGSTLQNFLGLNTSAAVSLALFHSVFNIVGVILMWPISSTLVAFLTKRFSSREEEEAQPRYLDKNVLTMPYLAIDSMALEIKRIAEMSFSYTLACLNNIRDQLSPLIIRSLCKTVGNYAVELNRGSLTPFVSEALSNLIESMQEFLFVLDLSDDIVALHGIHGHTELNTEMREAALNFSSNIQLYLKGLASTSPEDLQRGVPDYEEIENAYRVFKKIIMHQAATGRLAIERMDILLQYANAAKRSCRHLNKAQRRLLNVQESLQRNAAGEVTPTALPESENLARLQESDTQLDNEKP